MRVILGTTELTKYVEDGSYVMDSVNIEEKWLDGWKRTHTIKIREKVKGSFNVICCENTISTADFLQLIKDNADVTDTLTIYVWVNNKGVAEAIQCHYVVTTVTHTSEADIFKVTLEER